MPDEIGAGAKSGVRIQPSTLTFVGQRVPSDVADVVVVLVAAAAVAAVHAVGQLPGDALRPHDVVPDQLIHKKRDRSAPSPNPGKG